MSGLLSYFGWAVLPNYVTSILQSVYYGITIRAGDPRPQPGTPRFDKHRRRIFIFVVTAYLVYTLYESFYQVRATGDFYNVLGVSPLADERTIKSRFRRLAAQYHPDKANQLPNGGGTEGVFVYLKLAQDTLLDPARRFGYDRFGPTVNEWRNSSTMQDFLYAGLKQALVQYTAGLATIVVLNFVYWSAWGRYWRFYTFAGLVVLELVLMTQPLVIFMPQNYIPASLLAYFPQAAPKFYLLPFQIISLARRVSITIHIFISQITPAQSASAAAGTGLNPQTVQRLGQMVQLSKIADTEASGLLYLTLSPFRGDRESVATLRRGMKEGLVLGSVRNTPEVKEAVTRAQQRRVRVDEQIE
ncbi:putative membrane associated DnaJ chaperone [Talaromyces proteolyticus]|uniref:Membrane associated DnaJ chaperone n=1 Tax=Talaromyces proteolyticus TaxID=1131652 RepID=A0AAD4PWH4_9EURO|nr:putative membrane associated DnaJ chaperone [Talaromyces proteolyticus]KAH8692398.1 putative membrane associated DnaJ chaperone [Talaromyces proteolyticus]